MLIAPRASNAEVQDGGIIGADILQYYDVELNFPAHTVSFFEPQHCVPKTAFKYESLKSMAVRTSSGGHLFVPLVLDGKSFEGLIDTGAAVSF